MEISGARQCQVARLESAGFGKEMLRDEDRDGRWEDWEKREKETGRL